MWKSQQFQKLNCSKGWQYDNLIVQLHGNFWYRNTTSALLVQNNWHSNAVHIIWMTAFETITIYCSYKKISSVGDWRSTSLEWRFQTFKGSWPWPWPWFRPYGIPSCIIHRPLPTYPISLRSEENFFRKSPLRFWSSLKSRDRKTRTNIKNPARSNLDIML